MAGNLTKVIIGASIALVVFAIVGAIGIGETADMDTDGATNNTNFSSLATLMIVPALILVVGVGVKLGKGFGLF